MKELLYGTTNPGKLESMRESLSELPFEVIGLLDLKQPIPEALEEGDTPLFNARQKALIYYRHYKRPVFSCDSGLYFRNLPKELQPGVHVRRVNGKTLSDEEMLVYYANLAKEHGDLVAYYQNAICLVMDENHIFECMDESIQSGAFLLTHKPHQTVVPGFPLDRISLDIKSKLYFYDLDETSDEDDDLYKRKGFLNFFRKVFSMEVEER